MCSFILYTVIHRCSFKHLLRLIAINSRKLAEAKSFQKHTYQCHTENCKNLKILGIITMTLALLECELGRTLPAKTTSTNKKSTLSRNSNNKLIEGIF